MIFFLFVIFIFDIFKAVEIEFFCIWHNPITRPELQIQGENNLSMWRNKNVTDKQWQDYTRLAWDISPVLAVYLPERYKTFDYNFYSDSLLSS